MLHFLVHIKGFHLVFDERIALPIGAQADAFLEHVHIVQMLHPLGIDDFEHDRFFQLAHHRRTDRFLTTVVCIVRRLFEEILHVLARIIFDVFRLDISRRDAIFLTIFDERRIIPFLRIELRIRIHLHALIDEAVDHPHDLVFHVFPVQNPATLLIKHLALLIHDVVIFQDIFTDIEIPCLHAFLRPLNRIGNHGGFDLFVFLQPHFFHEIFDAVPAENAKQIIFQRQEKLRTAGIPLASGTSAQLIVDTTTFMALRPNNGEPAQLGDPFAQRDIRPAPGHIRRNRDLPSLPGLRDDIRFHFMKLRI